MNNNQPDNTNDLKELAEKIERLDDLIERWTSWKFIWLRGISVGVAGAIGATLIAGIIFGLLGQFFNLADLPGVQNLFNSTRTPGL